MYPDLIVSASGIRGVVGAGLRPEIACRYGAAFAAYLRERVGGEGTRRRVLLGRDTRTSGEMLADAAAAGVRSAGFHVRDAGIVPTPSLMLAVAEDEEAAGGLLVTASHNPAQWNGLKFCGPKGRFLEPEETERVEELFRDGSPRVAWENVGDRGRHPGAIERHVDRVLALPVVDRGAIAERDLLVALDCVHGAGALALPLLLERLGCRVAGIGLEPDGRFPRDPEPVPRNLGALGALVREAAADVGMAVDPDGDRLALVDEMGRPIGEDWTLALAVEVVLARRPGPVVTNLSTSQCVRDVVRAAGQTLHLAPVGEANVARTMAEVGAVIGGEGNGGVMFPELHTTRDAVVAAALVLQAMAERGGRLGDLLEGRPRYCIVKRKAPRPAGPPEELYARVRGELGGGATVDRQDGLRLTWADRWLHLRPSGTEPVFRVVAEAPEEEAAQALVRRAEELLGA